MQAEFWYERWASNDIGFHQPEANHFLTKYMSQLELPVGGRVFLPLCGKSLDIHWLLAQGYAVAGAELSEMAVQQLFEELGLEAAVRHEGTLKCYSAPQIDIWVGDIFELDKQALGPVGAVYDRAALVALPLPTRHRYTQHLMAITGRVRQLLICFEYDQSLMEGPPFSITDTEVESHYGSDYQISLLEAVPVVGGFRTLEQADEKAVLLI
ncbi:thiopurine S-methyltransferase [Maricurvus nonylphenolicus]|uniref:thiopurine S-methyltransferase n=1 Tax=Maricurvus nonylphenolicus TaxID=1008307 RepID=UPI0036F2651F